MFIYKNSKKERIFINVSGISLKDHIKTSSLYLFTDLENSPVKIDVNMIDRDLLKIPISIPIYEITETKCYNYNNIKIIDVFQFPESKIPVFKIPESNQKYPESTPLFKIPESTPLFKSLPKCHRCINYTKRHLFQIPGYTCNICNKTISQFSYGTRCDTCDFDVCTNCLQYKNIFLQLPSRSVEDDSRFFGPTQSKTLF